MNFTWLYVGAVYAAAIALARRARVAISWRIAALFYAIVLAFFFVPLTTDTINIQVDYIRTLPPWKDVAPIARVSNPWMNDVPLQLVPWAHQVRESWKSLRIPLWNEAAGSGYPLLANAVSAAMSPLRFLALPLPLGQSFTAEAAWKVLIALTFTFLYCRRRDYSTIASIASSITFAFCGFMLVWLQFPQSTVACFAPAVLYSIDLLAERVTYGRFLFSVGLWWTIVNGGHPETAAHCGFLALLAIVWIAAFESRERVRFAVASIGSVAVAALLAAPLLMPFFEGVTKSLRFEALKGSPHPAHAFADWASTIGMLEPHFFGLVPHEDPWGPGIPETICGWVVTFAVAAAFATFFHVVASRRWRSREAFFVAATIVSIAIIYSWPGVTEAFNLVFGLAANTRVRFIFALMLALQAGAAIDLLQRGHWRPYLLGIICTAALLLTMMTFDFPDEMKRTAAIRSLIPPFLTLLIAVCAVPDRIRKGAIVVLVAAIGAEVWVTLGDWNPAVASSELFPKTPILQKLDQLRLQSRTPFRVVGYGATLYPNSAAMYGLEDIRTHDAMAGARYLGLLSVNTGFNITGYFMQWYNTEARLLDYLNVRYFISFPGATMTDWRWHLVYDGKDGRIFENADVLPRFFPVDAVILDFRWNEFVQRLKEHEGWATTAILNDLKVENDRMRTDLLAPRPPNAPRATLQLMKQAPTDYTMRVVAPRYTLVVSSVPWWPGWKVVRNGKRVDPIRVNGAFTGFAVPPGTSDVHVYYSPNSFWAGVWVAAVTLIALAALAKFPIQPLPRHAVDAGQERR